MKGIESGDKPEKDINGTDEEFHGDHDQVEKVNKLDFIKKIRRRKKMDMFSVKYISNEYLLVGCLSKKL